MVPRYLRPALIACAAIGAAALPVDSLVIATLGLSLGIKQLVKAGYSAQPFPFPSPFPGGQFSIGTAAVSYADVGTLLLAGIIVIGLQAFLNRTVTGRAMQAVAQNTDAPVAYSRPGRDRELRARCTTITPPARARRSTARA